MRNMCQFSVRSLLLAISFACVWMGILCSRARVQMEAVAELCKIGAIVHYDLHPELAATDNCILTLLDGAMWNGQKQFMHHVLHRAKAVAVGIECCNSGIKGRNCFFIRPDASLVEEAIPVLRRLPFLREVYVGQHVSEGAISRIKSALPRCEVTRVRLGVASYDFDD